MKKKTLALVLAFTMTAALFTGCGSKKETETTQTQTETAAETESAESIWFLIRSHTIRDRVRSDCRLSQRKPMMGRMYRSQSIQ